MNIKTKQQLAAAMKLKCTWPPICLQKILIMWIPIEMTISATKICQTMVYVTTP